MASKITFTIETDGIVRDCAIAEMSDEALEWSINSVCDARGYKEEIGVSKERYFSWMIRKWVEAQVDRYAAKLATAQAAQVAEAIKNTVVIHEVQE